MISTVDTKQEQLANGYFKRGSGPEKILVIGSCRSVPYLEYLVRADKANRFTICFIDPFSWHWNERDEFINFEEKINSLETDQRILELLASTNIYLHEYYDSFGMWNSSKEAEKNIYQFGLNPTLDICIPNFNNIHILGQPIEEGEAALEKFYHICQQTSFPEMEWYFRGNWRSKRMFWTHNHVSNYFTMFIFNRLNERFLHLPLTDEFWNDIAEWDLFANTPQPVSDEDRANYQLKW